MMKGVTAGAHPVGQYESVWTAVPSRTPANHSVDGPLMGNGDMAVAVGGPPEVQCFYLAKNDFWRLKSEYGKAYPATIGHLAVRIPRLEGARFLIKQTWAVPETVATFTQQGTTVRMRSLVAATRNILLVELTTDGPSAEAEVWLKVDVGAGSHSRAERRGGICVGRRAFTDAVDIPTGAAVAWSIQGAETHPVQAAGEAAVGVGFTLKKGNPVTLVLAMDSLFKNSDYVEGAVRALSSVIEASALSSLCREHAAWWADYWSKSVVEIGDPVLERDYYRSLYSMGALSRDPRFPPALFGIITSGDPMWLGDYHLNYNHQAPFYGLYSANRIEQADPEDAPLLDFRERGRWYAANATKTRGVLYPVGIGPLGIETTFRSPEYGESCYAECGGLFFQQRSNAAYCLVNIAERWRRTYDPSYGQKVYPLVRDVVDFWEDYLQWEPAAASSGREGRYIIVRDAIHEASGHNLNPILSLGLVRNAVDLALDMSTELGIDADRRAKWTHILENLSTWSTQERDGLNVFRYTETGPDWWKGGTLGTQHIYPANALGLDSEPTWLDVARNTIRVMGRWHDFNGSNSFFPAAVRVGFDPETILAELRRYAENTYPNGFQQGNPHGIETFSTVPNTINEMLCMSHVPVGVSNRAESVLRVFPAWPKGRDAQFANLRTWGAFLVASERKDGRVAYVRILSERGRFCTVQNPWPGREVTVHRNGRPAETCSGERFTLKTECGEVLLLQPAGTGEN